MSVKEIVSIVVAGVVGLVWAILELKRWRSNRKQKELEEEHALLQTPVRCADHEGRLRKVEEVCSQFKPGHDDLIHRVEVIGGDVKTLLNMHLKN